MVLLQSGAGASGRSRRTGLRVIILSVASLFLLDGCRTWDDSGDWHSHRRLDVHQHRRQPPHHPPPPAPVIAPKFHPPAQPPPLPAQPAYRPPPPSGHHGHHQRSGDPSRRPDRGAGHGSKRHEHKSQGDHHGKRR